MIEQGSEAWHLARAGKITASNAEKPLAKAKNGERKEEGRKYLVEKVTELLTGLVAENFQVPAMKWGHENEPKARGEYEMQSGNVVEEAPFILHPSVPYVGGSPDGMVGGEGIIEIKCPFNPTIHMDTVINGVPEKHIPQIQTNLWVTGRQWCDFISYDPRFPAPYALYVRRIEADPKYHAMLAEEFAQFWAEVNVTLKSLKEAVTV